MRYVLLDRITHFDRGRSLSGLKNVSVSDDLVTSYGTGVSALPSTMVLEAMAQAAGLLVAGSTDCRYQPLLAKVRPFTVNGLARPGDQLHVLAELEEFRDEGCRAHVTASIDQRPFADATIYLALLSLTGPGLEHCSERLRAVLADTFPDWFSVASPAESAP